MDAEKRLGIILIMIGFLIPLIVLPFVSGFSKDKSFLENFYNVGIAIRKDTNNNALIQPLTKTEETSSKAAVSWSQLIPKTIQFRFFLIPTVILVYMGIIRIERSRRKKQDH
jgi:hypothetical protein